MLGRGGIKNLSYVASRTSRSRKVMGGQLKAILDPIFAIEHSRIVQNSRFRVVESPAQLVAIRAMIHDPIMHSTSL